jgi:hypothetical protein
VCSKTPQNKDFQEVLNTVQHISDNTIKQMQLLGFALSYVQLAKNCVPDNGTK